MTFVTRISLRSGDREALETAVTDIAETCRRKGAELKGPHSDSPSEYRVPLYGRLDGDPSSRFDEWKYTVFQRRFELRGHDDLARQLLEREFPNAVRIEVEVEQIGQLDS
ncbi:MAG: 30S ribosomal protein S10 [Halodesulfurarchaeum sp.]